MTTKVSESIVNENVTAEMHTKGIVTVIKDWVCGKGFYDLVSLFGKTLSQCHLAPHLKSEVGTFVAVSSIPNFIRSSCTVIETGQKYCHMTHEEKTKPHFVWDTAHQVLDLGAATGYVSSFLTQNKRILNFATFFCAGSDICDGVAEVFHVKETKNRLAQSQNTTIKKACNDNVNLSWIKIAKSTTAAVAGVLACLFIVGVALVPASVGLSISLVSLIIGISSYYFENYYCDYALKIEPKLA